MTRCSSVLPCDRAGWNAYSNTDFNSTLHYSPPAMSDSVARWQIFRACAHPE